MPRFKESYILFVMQNYKYTSLGIAAFHRKFKTNISVYVIRFVEDITDLEAMQNLIWVCTWHINKGLVAPEDIDIPHEDWPEMSQEIFSALTDCAVARSSKLKKDTPVE